MAHRVGKSQEKKGIIFREQLGFQDHRTQQRDLASIRISPLATAGVMAKVGSKVARSFVVISVTSSGTRMPIFCCDNAVIMPIKCR
jgi:hypothetical protein